MTGIFQGLVASGKVKSETVVDPDQVATHNFRGLAMNSSGAVLICTTDSATPAYIGGLRVGLHGVVLVAAGATTHHSQGGSPCVADSRLAFSQAAATHYHSGVPLNAAGVVFT